MAEMTRHLFRIIGFIAIIFLTSGCGMGKSAQQKAALPMEWPPPLLSEQQIIAVRECDLENLSGERYPKKVKSDDLVSKYAPESDCDWAVLALAYAERLGEDEPLSESAIYAFSQAIAYNYGFALATPIFYRYFGATSIVKSPPFSQQEITNVRIQYNWGGLGDEVNYTVEIHQANASPTVQITPNSMAASAKINVDKESIQALSSALNNLLPVKSKFSINPCTDNYPQWSVQITFKDGTNLNLTSDSNFIPIGGPWIAEVNQQNYVQFSTEFIKALDKVITSMKLPYGQPVAWTCFKDDVFDKAFP